ncbi:MAG: alpha/beta fold hydrolase [Rhodospirillaceae bacterium]
MTRLARSALAWGLASAAVSATLIRYKTYKAERENPPRGQFIDADGVRLHYIERGLGIPLVMLHGSETTAQDFEWSGLMQIACRRFRAIVFDRRGFGHSLRPRGRAWSAPAQAALLHHAIKRLGVEKPIVLGHSWGALIALEYALQFPDEVRSLVLLSGLYYPSRHLNPPLAAMHAIPVLGEIMRYTVSPWLGRAMWRRRMRRAFAPRKVTGSAHRIPAWMMLRPSHLRAAAAENALTIPSALSLMRRYAQIKVPLHIVVGDADRFSDVAQSERLHRDTPGSHLHTIRGAGHMIHHVAPDEVLAAIDHAAGPSPGPSPLMEDASKVVAQIPTGGDMFKRLKE